MVLQMIATPGFRYSALFVLVSDHHVLIAFSCVHTDAQITL
jgi:hypothetical protein